MPLLPYDHVSFPVLLDLIAPFDKVDHKILIHTNVHLDCKRSLPLEVEFSWFVLYVTHRSLQVSVEGVMSDVFDLYLRAPQGSCLGPGAKIITWPLGLKFISSGYLVST